LDLLDKFLIDESKEDSNYKLHQVDGNHIRPPKGLPPVEDTQSRLLTVGPRGTVLWARHDHLCWATVDTLVEIAKGSDEGGEERSHPRGKVDWLHLSGEPRFLLATPDASTLAIYLQLSRKSHPAEVAVYDISNLPHAPPSRKGQYPLQDEIRTWDWGATGSSSANTLCVLQDSGEMVLYNLETDKFKTIRTTNQEDTLLYTAACWNTEGDRLITGDTRGRIHLLSAKGDILTEGIIPSEDFEDAISRYRVDSIRAIEQDFFVCEYVNEESEAKPTMFFAYHLNNATEDGFDICQELPVAEVAADNVGTRHVVYLDVWRLMLVASSLAEDIDVFGRDDDLTVSTSTELSRSSGRKSGQWCKWCWYVLDDEYRGTLPFVDDDDGLQVVGMAVDLSASENVLLQEDGEEKAKSSVGGADGGWHHLPLSHSQR